MISFSQLSLSRKILLGVVPLFLVFITVSVLLQNIFQEEEMMEQAQSSAQAYAKIIKESLVSMMINNLAVDNSFLSRVNAIEHFDSVTICINDLHLRPELMTPDRIRSQERKRQALAPTDSIQRWALAKAEPVYLKIGDQFRAVVPFTARDVCQKCHAVPVGYSLGAADMHVSFANFREAQARDWKISLTIFVLFTVFALTVATVIFTRHVSRPVERLVNATGMIASGNLDAPVSIPGGAAYAASRDELAILGKRFEEMRASLKEKIQQLDGLNTNLQQRNRDVEEALTRLRLTQENLVRSERLAVTGKMTAQLSHEINNPIHNIQSLLQSLAPKLDDNAQAKEIVQIALEEVLRMAKLTRQMLDVYRGSMIDIRKEPVDLRSILDEVVRAHREMLARSGVTILLGGPSAPLFIHGSADKMKQLFSNLIINARDAMSAGGTVRIDAGGAERTAIVEVADTGSGIRPEYMNRVFDAFFTTKEEVSGVGLGLFVCYNIVQQHDGAIRVKSRVGEGTTFTVEIPRSTGERA
jgi:signal transduction histidine kinase